MESGGRSDPDLALAAGERRIKDQVVLGPDFPLIPAGIIPDAREDAIHFDVCGLVGDALVEESPQHDCLVLRVNLGGEGVRFAMRAHGECL